MLFLAHQIGISHISIPARRKDNKQTDARRPHVGRTSISDVHRNVQITSPCRISAYSGFSRSLF